MTGTLIIQSSDPSGGWTEGIRIKPAPDNWTTLILGASGNRGTDTNAWSLHTNNGTFYFANNGADNFDNGLSWTNTGNLNIKSTSSFTYNSNTIWHSGNDGSGSGLDADSLDGYHAGFSNGKILKLINFPECSYFGSSIDSNDYYQNIIKWVYNNANNGDTTLAIGVGCPNSLGNLQIQLYGTSGYDSTTNFPRYSSAIYYPLGNNPPVIFGTVDYTYYQYTIARTTDNVASATKLQTAHSIWGQSFDGTANVSGALSGVSTISMSGQLTSTLASGTAPFSIASTSLNYNLNADLLDGYHATSFMRADANATTTGNLQIASGGLANAEIAIGNGVATGTQSLKFRTTGVEG